MKESDWFIYLLIGLITGMLLNIGGTILKITSEKNQTSNQTHYEKVLNGFYYSLGNQTEIKKYQNETDPNGEWICINIREMDAKKALDTCKHEVGHAIYQNNCYKYSSVCLDIIQNTLYEDFANYCQKNITACLGVENE